MMPISRAALPNFKKILALILLSHMSSMSTAVFAQATHMMIPEGSKEIDFGVAAIAVAKSEGSSQRRLLVLPFASIRWSNGVFLAPGELGWALPSDQPSISYGPLLAYGFKPERTDSQSSSALLAEAGGFFNYRLAQDMGFKSRLLYGGADQHQGVQVNLSAWMSARITRDQAVSLELGTTLADAAYMQSYFGVSAAQAAHGPYPAYQLGGGVKNTFVSINWGMQLTPKYDVVVRLGSSYLYGAVADSPLTSSRRASSVVTSITYHY